jgi:hypothetical protein
MKAASSSKPTPEIKMTGAMATCSTGISSDKGPNAISADCSKQSARIQPAAEVFRRKEFFTPFVRSNAR